MDRAAGDAAVQVYPDLIHSVRSNRAFMTRAVRYLADEAGIRQFPDIGTGIPTAPNTPSPSRWRSCSWRSCT